uniref:Uncharacterized protein n=1 Tax=Lotus japonicus TaxID=34305 RepID=I3SH15_LOTJA|nr:unknown [Lotus japonicus]
MCAQNFSAHFTSPGVFSWSRNFTRLDTSTTLSHPKKLPKAISRYPIWSPPKKIIAFAALLKCIFQQQQSFSHFLYALIPLIFSFCASNGSHCRVPLVINKGSPEASDGAFIRIRRKNGRGRGPDLINILHNDQRLANGFVLMKENRNFLMNRVRLKKKLAFGLK